MRQGIYAKGWRIRKERELYTVVDRFVFGSSFDLFLADESGVAFSLSSSTEGEIAFVGGSLSVSASEVTARYKEREGRGGGRGRRKRDTFALRSACLYGNSRSRSRVLLPACLPDLM